MTFDGALLRWLSVGLILAFVPACVGSTYRIAGDDLARIATMPPESRGVRVRAVQRMSGADEPPRAGAAQSAERERSSGGGGGNFGGSFGGGGGGRGAGVALLVLLLTAGIVAAFSEGARYDGWVELDPNHPIHLRLADDSFRWVPLAALRPADLVGVEEAVVRPEEGSMRKLARAPLDRVGFHLLAEAGTVLPDEGQRARAVGRVGFGGFPLQQLGVLANVSMGPPHAFPRFTVEVEAFPVTVGTFSPGLYLEAGTGFPAVPTASGTERRAGSVFGGGGLLQFALTTRLTLNLRAGATALLRDVGTDLAAEWSAGFGFF